MITPKEFREYTRRADAVIAESSKNIKRMQAEHEESMRQREARINALLSPSDEEDIAETKGGQFFRGGTRMPSTDEILTAFANPDQKKQLFDEAEELLNPKQVKQDSPQPIGKWFGDGDRIPSVEDMKDPVKHQEMLQELDSIFRQ